MRLFAAIRPPDRVLDHLANALDLISLPHQARNPWAPRANWHITLAFYGEVPDGLTPDIERRLDAVVQQTPPFRLSLAGAGVFNRDTCWVGVDDPSGVLPKLASELRDDLTAGKQHAANRFHLTLSRAGRQAGLGDAMRALAVYRGPEWPVERITLYRSDLGQGVGGHPLYTSVHSAGWDPSQ